jgi:hypothetical protein
LSKTTFEAILEQLREELAENGHELTWSLNGEASEESLVACEIATGIALPTDFRDFLRGTNGVSIKIDAEPYHSPDLEIFNPGKVVERYRGLVAQFRKRAASAELDASLGLPQFPPEASWSRLVPFAHYGVGDCLFYVPSGIGSTGTIVDMDSEDIEGAIKNTIAQTFDEWLSRVVESIRSHYHVEYWLLEP